MNTAWHLALVGRGSGKDSEKFGESEMTRACFDSEKHLWNYKGEGESRRGEWWGGVQDNSCRIEISREDFPNHQDLLEWLHLRFRVSCVPICVWGCRECTWVKG